MSILAVDFGSIHTRAVLIDQVEGVYQLIARAQTRSTDGFPVGDLMVGLERATRDLSQFTGRNFTGDSGALIIPENADRSGVDVFVATASTGRPMRCVVIDLVPDYSGQSAYRAVAGTYAEVIAEINLLDERTLEERANVILLSQPDVVLIVGGTDAGANDSLLGLVDAVRLAALVTPASQRPVILYAGNRHLAAQVRAEFDGISEVLISQNVRPQLEDESLKDAQRQLAEAYELYKQSRSDAFARITQVSASGVVPTAQSYTTVMDYLNRQVRRGVLVLDIGSASSVLSMTTGGEITTAIRTDLGMGHNALQLLDTVGVEAVRGWLPFNISARELYNYAANKTLRPMTVPAILRETYIEHALLRAAGRHMFSDARPPGDTSPAAYDLLIAAGATLTEVGNPAYTAMLLLDIVQPEGVTHVMSDSFGLLPALGAVAPIRPEAVVQVLDNTNNLEPIGYAFSVSGKPALDKPAMKVKITLAHGEVIQEVVPGGYIWVYRLPLNQPAEVVVSSARRGLSIGGRRRVKMKVMGGTAGLVFDARGRPLSAGASVRERAVFLPVWLTQATDYELIEIDPAWLEPVSDDDTDDDQVRPDRRHRRGRGRQARQAQSATPRPTDDHPDPMKELRDASLS